MSFMPGPHKKEGEGEGNAATVTSVEEEREKGTPRLSFKQRRQHHPQQLKKSPSVPCPPPPPPACTNGGIGVGRSRGRISFPCRSLLSPSSAAEVVEEENNYLCLSVRKDWLCRAWGGEEEKRGAVSAAAAFSPLSVLPCCYLGYVMLCGGEPPP